MYAGGHHKGRRFSRLQLLRLWCQHVFHAASTFAADLQGRSANGKIRVRHAHHRIGDAVSLMLEGIVNGSDDELRRYDARERRSGGRKWRLRLVRLVGRKHWDLAKIPGGAARHLSDRRVLSTGL
jgi:hypothetical protein